MTYNRKDLAVRVNIKSLKGYTMRDIGSLEDRIKKLEYYTVLNALALDTKSLSIRDDAGQFERFKNGIFADPFNDYTLSRIEDREFASNISAARSILLPRYESDIVQLKYQSTASSNIRTAGKLAMIDYDVEKLGGNPYATTYRNCTESFYSFKGSLQLFPSYDPGKSVIQGAPQNVTIDIAGAFNKFLATGIAQHIDTEVARPILTNSTTVDNGDWTATQTNYFSETTTKTIKDIGVDIQNQNINIGPVVRDVSVLPYMRSRVVAVVARGLKPNTTVHCFFDKINVDQYCRSGVISTSFADINGEIDPSKLRNLVEGQENLLVTATGPYFSQQVGTHLKTNSRGTIYLTFSIPENTFRTGDRVFTISNVDNLNAKDAIVTLAEGIYAANALSVTTSEISFSVLNPTFKPTTTIESSTREWSESSTWSTWVWVNEDPIAETFVIQEAAQVNVPGVYLTSIGVYFRSKDPILGASLYISETTNGIVDSSRIIGTAYLTSSSIGVSSDSSVETVFTLDTPALLQTNKTYAFFVVPENSNPNYELWISEVGGFDKLTEVTITKQPFPGVMQVSSNGKAWTTVQSQDIKFNLYRAKFKYNTASVTLSNDTDDYLTLENTYRINNGVGIQVGQVVYSANSSNTQQIFTNSTTHPFGIVSSVDELNNRVYLERSNGLFNNTALRNVRFYSVRDYANTAEIITNNLIANSQIKTIDDLTYHQVAPKVVVMEPIGTNASFKYYGTSNSSAAVGSYVKDTTQTYLNFEQIFEFRDFERVVRSYSNEIAQGGFGTRGNTTLDINLTSENNYVSPVVDLSTKNVKIFKNIISANNFMEHTRFGYALNRYVSQVVSLVTPAEDLKVYVTAYRPSGTDVEVYAKFLSNNDSDKFDNKDWTKLTTVVNDSGTNTGSLNSNYGEDYKELIFGIPTGTTPVGNVSISSTTMTVHDVTGAGLFANNQTVVGAKVVPGTKIVAVGASTGGAGTYTITPSQSPAGYFEVKGAPASPSAFTAYADSDAYTYSNGKLTDKVVTYFDSTYALQTSFSKFALKIVMLSNNPVKVPNLRDVRAIALMLS